MKKLLIVIAVSLLFLSSGGVHSKAGRVQFTLPQNTPEETLQTAVGSNLPGGIVKPYVEKNQEVVTFRRFPDNLLKVYVVPCKLQSSYPKGAKLINLTRGTLEFLANEFGFTTQGKDALTTKGSNVFFMKDSTFKWVVIFIPRRYNNNGYLDAYIFKVHNTLWTQFYDEFLESFIKTHLIGDNGK